MDLDYKAIGQRIKAVRLKRGLTQEQLVELTGISNSHISNIETGHTKIGLPTLIIIANALYVTADKILCDNLNNSVNLFKNEIMEVIKDCSDYEIKILADTCSALKTSLRKRKQLTDL